jgi:ligand-binding sensor domain-containing protein
MNINKLTLFSLLWTTVFFTSSKGQETKNFPGESATIPTGLPKLIKTQGSGHGDNVHNSLQDKNGNFWFVTTGDGVYRYNGKSFKNFTTKDGLNTNCVLSILEDKKGNIWFGTSAGVSLFDGKTLRQIPSTSFFVYAMLEDKSGKLWFGTNNGVYCYDGKSFIGFLDKDVVNSYELDLKSVNRMLQDKHGNIWFTTKMEGLCHYDGKSLINYKPKDETYFWGLLEDKTGKIWVGGRNKGVFCYDGKTFTNVLQHGQFDSSMAGSIIQDKSGNLWFGTEAGDPSKRETEGGVWRYDGKTFKNFLKKDGLNHNSIWSLLEDKAGNIWVGTRNTGLYRFDGKTFTSFSE